MQKEHCRDLKGRWPKFLKPPISVRHKLSSAFLYPQEGTVVVYRFMMRFKTEILPQNLTFNYSFNNLI